MFSKLSSLRLHNKIFFTYSLVLLLMFAVIFGIATILINRTFNAQLDKDVNDLKKIISDLYRQFLQGIRKEVAAKGEDEDVLEALKTAERGGIREIPPTNFDVFECGNSEGILVLSQLDNDPRIGSINAEILKVKTDDKGVKDTIRERIIRIDEDPQLVVEVTQWWEWGFITGGKSLQKWLIGALLSQPSEHPVFLVKKKDEQEEWVSLNTSAHKSPNLKEEWEKQLKLHQAEGKPIEGLVVTMPSNQQSVSLDTTSETLDTPIYTVFRADILRAPYITPNQLPFVELIIAYSHEERIQWQDRMLIILFWSVGAGAFLVYCSSFLISRRITRPIAELQKGVNEISEGNLSYQIAVESKGEVGELAEGFNNMALALRKSLEEHRSAERIAVWRDVARQLAHEIKNPLFPIRLSVENLQAAKGQPEIFERIFKECTDTIIEEVDRIRGLIDEFHQYARLPAPDRNPISINEIVNTVVKLYMEFSQAQNIEIVKELSSLPPLSLDREQMERAIGNLVKNAIEAMPNGGVLTLRTFATPISEDFTDGRFEEDRDTHIEIKDTGHGMSKEALKNLFNPDFTTKADGTGLGMPIVRRIITVHDGEIDVKSQENVGTTVRITFKNSSYHTGEKKL